MLGPQALQVFVRKKLSMEVQGENYLLWLQRQVCRTYSISQRFNLTAILRFIENIAIGFRAHIYRPFNNIPIVFDDDAFPIPIFRYAACASKY